MIDSSWIANLRAEHRAKLPKNDDGECVCPRCSRVIPDPQTNCVTCDEERKTRAALQAFDERFAEAAGWARSDVPAVLPRWDWARFANEAWSSNVHPKIRSAGHRWAPSMGNLALCGPTGCGKTSTVVAMLHAEHERVRTAISSGHEADPKWWPFLFVSAIDVIAEKRTHRLGTADPRLLELAKSTRSVLIFDEIGFEDLRDQTIFEIADSRNRLGLRSVITTGRTPAEFTERYGAACWRRFTEAGHVIDAFPRRVQS